MGLERSKFISLLIIPLFLLVIAILYLMNNPAVFEPPLVLPVLNTVFLGIIPLFIAFIVYQTYRSSGSVSVLLLGSGMLVFGLGSIAAGWLNGLPGGSNLTPTIHNTSVCIGAIFSLAAVLIAFSGSVSVSRKGNVYIPFFVYGGIVAFVALFSFAAVEGFIPLFFIQGTGPTVLRQVILSNATEMYALTSVLFFILYIRKKDDFFFWFSIGLALIAIGLGAVFIQPAVGSLVGWAGRTAQYAGACFAFVAFIVLWKRATKEGIPSPDLLARFFGTSETGYKLLVETAPDAIVVIRDNRFLYANDAALRLYGAEAFDELRSNTVIDLVPSEERGILMNQIDQIQSGISLPGQEMRIIRRDGAIIDVAVRASSIDYLGTPAVIGIIRDITARKKTEEALRLQDQELQLKNSQLQALFDYSNASLVLFDAKPPYTVLAHNKYYQELWAEPFRSKGMVGKNIFDYVPGVEVQGVKVIYDEVVSTRQAKNLIGFPYDGMERGRTWWNWHLSPVMQGDKVVALAHMAFDVTREAEARIKAEEALSLLKASEDRLSLAQEAAGAGTWDWDVVTGEIVWAPRLYELFGINPGMNRASFDIWNTILHPDDRDGANAQIRHALDQHTILDSEYRIIRPDGTIRWINARGQGIYDNAGQPVRMYGICLDITVRKQTEAALRESEERYRMIVDTAQEGIVLTNPEGKIIFVNERFAQLLGYSAKELVGKAGLDLAAERERESAGKKINERRKGEREHYEIWMLRKDGREVCMLTSGNPIRDSDGKHLGNLGMYTDITERKHTEEALLESESILRNFFDSPGVMRGIVEVIAEDDVLHIADNSTTAAFVGLTPETMKNKKGSELGEPRDILRMWIGHYIESQQSGKPMIFEYHDKRGDTEAWLQVTVSYLAISPAGNPRFAYVGLDITQRKQMEEALRESEERFRLALAHAPVSVAIQDRDLVFRWAYNQRTIQPEDVIGRTDTDLFDPENAKHLIEMKRCVLEIGTAIHEKLWLTSNGRRWFLEVYLEPLRDKLGQITGIGIATVDLTEQMQAEEALREAQARTATILEGIADTFYSLDDQWRFTMVNPAAEKAPFEKRAMELIGRVIWDLYPDLVGTPIHRHYLDAAEKHSLEHYVAQSPLNKRWYEVFMQGWEGGVDVYMRDITGRKEAENALRENEQRLNLSLEVSQMGTWDLDLIHHTAHRSLRHDQIFGYRDLLPEWTYEMFLDHVIPEDREDVDRKFQEAIEKHEDWNFECPVLRNDGITRWIHARGRSEYDPGGKPVRMIGIVLDITERKRAEEALKESEEKYRSIVETANEGIIIVDVESRISYVNEKFADLLGYRQDELIGTSSIDLFDKEYVSLALEEREQRQRRGIRSRYESRFIRKDGQSLWVLVNSSPVLDKDGRFAGSLGMVTDITERKQAEEKIESLLSDVGKEKDRLSVLINSISDEIWYADTTKKFTLANPPALKEFRLQLGDTIDVENLAISLEVLRPDGSPRPVEEAPPLRALAGEIVRNQVEIIRTPGHGELRYRQVSATPVRDEKGIIIGSVSVVRDITDLKRGEEALRNTSQYLENLISYANAPIIVWDPAFRITRFNHAFERLTGRKASEIIGQPLELLFPEKYTGIAMDIIRRTTRGERLEVVEIPILHVSGMVRTVLWNSATLFDSDGKTVLSTIAQGNDITERKKAEEELLRRNEDLNAANEEILATQEELQQSHDELLLSEHELRKTSQYLENLINYANAPIVVWDPHYVITRFNHAFEELTGRTAREIIGQRLEVLFPPQYLDASMEIIRKTLSGERLRVVEIPILNRRGEIRVVLWNSATLYESDGKTIQSTIAQGNDITERYITEAELEERNEELNNAIEELTQRGRELNEALKEKEVLLSEVHHRVKNNLTAFISLLSLESTYDDSPAGLALKKDLQNRARSMALIHETLYRTKKYSRVDMDVYLSTLVGQVVSSYETSKPVKTVVDTHGITLDLSRATPCGLIINELLTNSLKYAFPVSFDCEMTRGVPCLIEVNLTHDDGTYLLTVRDNGIGLPEDLDITTTKTLGLKLVNFLAKHQLRASIKVHSDGGADFRFRFRDKQ